MGTFGRVLNLSFDPGDQPLAGITSHEDRPQSHAGWGRSGLTKRSSLMTESVKTAAHEVHELLLEARPERKNENLAKAIHLAETASTPRDHFQLETFVAIRNLRTGLECGASAAEAEALLLHAIETANRWARHARRA